MAVNSPVSQPTLSTEAPKHELVIDLIDVIADSHTDLADKEFDFSVLGEESVKDVLANTYPAYVFESIQADIDEVSQVFKEEIYPLLKELMTVQGALDNVDRTLIAFGGTPEGDSLRDENEIIKDLLRAEKSIELEAKRIAVELARFHKEYGSHVNKSLQGTKREFVTKFLAIVGLAAIGGAAIENKYNILGDDTDRKEGTSEPSIITPRGTEYTTQSGDGWLKIARKHNVPVAMLYAANGANEKTPLHPGQKINVPQAPSESSASKNQ